MLIVEENDGGAKAKTNALLPPVGTRWRRADTTDTTIFDFDDDIATMAIIDAKYSKSNLVLQHPT